MKSLGRVPVNYGGRSCAFLLWLLNASQFPKKILSLLLICLAGRLLRNARALVLSCMFNESVLALEPPRIPLA